MFKIDIKPLSVNNAWKGRRFRTDRYKEYIKDLTMLLPPKSIVYLIDDKKKISLSIVVGFSSVLSDVDNPLKPFIDVLQNKYGFNDKMIYEIRVRKEIVEKGGEFIKFRIQEYDE
jgi:Holliday junction resolvase RusA-like endonuclease